MLLLPACDIEPAMVSMMPRAVLLPWSWILCGPSQPKTVTAFSSGEKPRVVWKGGQGLASRFSVAQKASLAGVAWVERSPLPGQAPETVSWMRRRARPSVALAGKPGPKQPLPA